MNKIICKIFGHKFWKWRQVIQNGILVTRRVLQTDCVRCGFVEYGKIIIK